MTYVCWLTHCLWPAWADQKLTEQLRSRPAELDPAAAMTKP